VVIVASVAGLRRTLPPEALLNRLLARIGEDGGCVAARPMTGAPGLGAALTGDKSDGLPF